jgi:hypothetical protein
VGRRLARVSLLVLAVALAGCGGGEAAGPTPQPEPEPARDTAPLQATPARALAVCRSLPRVRDLCPERVPAGRYGGAGKPPGLAGPYAQGGYAVCLDERGEQAAIGSGACVSEIFHLEAGAALGEDVRTNRPPRFVHVSLYASERSVPALFGLRGWCSGRRKPLADDTLLARGRTRGACLGRQLALMPPFPHGGELGGHLVLHRRRAGAELAVTLHAWAPLRETAATLRAVAASGQAGR